MSDNTDPPTGEEDAEEIMRQSTTLTGALHGSWTPPGTKTHCTHGKQLNACSECYKKELADKGKSV